MQRKSISWILEFTSRLPNDDEKVKCLQANADPSIKTVLKFAFDPNIKWLLPEGEPPYSPKEYESGELRENLLYNEARRLYLFVEGGNPDLKQSRRETLFVELLQELTPGDAKLLIAIKDKKLPYPGLDASVVKKAFPDLL